MKLYSDLSCIKLSSSAVAGEAKDGFTRGVLHNLYLYFVFVLLSFFFFVLLASFYQKLQQKISFVCFAFSYQKHKKIISYYSCWSIIALLLLVR